MRQLSPAGRQVITDIAQRHGFSVDATRNVLDALIKGNGSMAQFNHPEFAGSGQWMRGGMTMVSDMFNSRMKGRIDALCVDLSNVVASEPELVRSGSFQSQSQDDGGCPSAEQTNSGGDVSGEQQGGSSFRPASLFAPPTPGASDEWWPSDLRSPNSAGTQNGIRYAYFAEARRLAIDVGGTVTVYDTLDHQIGGFSQQQSVGGTLSFSSQHGPVDVASLPMVSSSGGQGQSPAMPPARGRSNSVPQGFAPPNGRDQDVFATIERLADLRAKGILSDDEFSAKKAELLSRV